jgi:AcrR family transcriptional regulator
MAAMVATCAERGYEATRVADLIELSAVSRKAFYEHFADKQSCFLATLDEILAAAIEATASQLRLEGDWEARGQGAVRTFVELLVSQPAAARLCMVEAYAAGPEATARVDAAFAGFQALAREHFLAAPQQPGVPAEMTRAMIGGLHKIVQTRLHRGRERELLDLVPELVTLAHSYRPPPGPLRTPRSAPAQAIPTGDRPADAAERLIRATSSVVASRGYAGATIAGIVKVAGTSFSTFYEHFDSKEDVFEAALYSSRSQMLAVVLPAYKRARSWPLGIRAVTEAIFAYMESNPEFARLVAIDVYAAGRQALERRDQAIEAAQRFLDDGAENFGPELKPIAREAIVSILYAMLSEHVRERGVKNLRAMNPLATYMALSPFVGAEQAYEVANRQASSGVPSPSDSAA